MLFWRQIGYSLFHLPILYIHIHSLCEFCASGILRVKAVGVEQGFWCRVCILRAIYYVAMPESWDKYIVAGLVFGIGGRFGRTLNKCFFSHPSGTVLRLDIF